MQNNARRYLIDALMFVDLCAVTFVGFLLACVIPTGPGRDKGFLGLHRHEWGDVHFTLCMGLLALLVLHIWMNYKWVVEISKRIFGGRWRLALSALCFAWIPLLLAAWLIALL